MSTKKSEATAPAPDPEAGEEAGLSIEFGEVKHALEQKLGAAMGQITIMELQIEKLQGALAKAVGAKELPQQKETGA